MLYAYVQKISWEKIKVNMLNINLLIFWIFTFKAGILFPEIGNLLINY